MQLINERIQELEQNERKVEGDNDDSSQNSPICNSTKLNDPSERNDNLLRINRRLQMLEEKAKQLKSEYNNMKKERRKKREEKQPLKTEINDPSEQEKMHSDSIEGKGLQALSMVS